MRERRNGLSLIPRVDSRHNEQVFVIIGQHLESLGVGVESRPEHLVRVRPDAPRKPYIPRSALVEEDEEVEVFPPDVLNVVRVRPGDEIQVAPLKYVRIYRAARA